MNLSDLGEPDFVNELGTKWWLDAGSTHYARQSRGNLDGMPGAAVFLTKTTDGYKTYMLTVDNVFIAESQQLEGIGFEIDKARLIYNMTEEEEAAIDAQMGEGK